VRGLVAVVLVEMLLGVFGKLGFESEVEFDVVGCGSGVLGGFRLAWSSSWWLAVGYRK
jgi:hypothetical protein